MFTAYSKFWKQYFDFKSRSKRSDFWWPFLINSVISFAFYIIILVALLVPYFERTAELANAGLASEGTSPWSTYIPGWRG